MVDQSDNIETKNESVLNYLLTLILNSGTSIFLMLYFLSLFSSYFLFSELLCHFQVFYLGCALFGLILGCILKKLPFILIHFVIAIYIISLIAPFYFGGGPQNKGEPILKIFQSNVEAINTKYDLVLKQIEMTNPDIVLLIETGSDWNKPTSSLQEKYPYQYKSLIGPFGYIFYSKIPVKTVVPKDFGTMYECLEIILTWEGKDIRLIGADPPPPMNEEMREIRNKHLLSYANLINQDKNIPTIICGDLNITPWSFNYKQLVEKADLKSTRQGFGLLASWPSQLPYRIPIDHCLITSQFGIYKTQVLSNVNSDHLPMLNEIFLIK